MRVPLGVIGIIYESRPNVTVDAAGLCVKAGNAVILRGGSEAIRSNTMMARLLATAGERAGLPPYSIQLIETTDRDAATALMRAEGLVDVLIPRGGEKLKKVVMENATVPVLTSLGRQLPHLHRRKRRLEHGGGHCFQRQSVAPVRVQRDGNPARSCRCGCVNSADTGQALL